jgi:KDO2-lipid IV(A) lauroyltransferase
METGMAWFWPTRRIARWTDSIGVEHIRDVQAQQRGILLIGIHFLTLEMGARMFGIEPGIGVYRPNDNPVIDWLQTWGRCAPTKT